MYTVLATIHDKVDSKNSARIVMPIIWWMIITFVVFGIAITVFPMLILLFFVCFLMIIPTTIICLKRSKEFKEKREQNRRIVQLVLDVKDSILYMDGQELYVELDSVDHRVFLSHIENIDSPRKFNITFAAVVEKENADDFLEFLRSNNVTINDLEA